PQPKRGARLDPPNGERVSLRYAIEKNKTAMLGEAVANRFGELPFLFKVLSAAQPLSIQVHPNKRNSEIGFAKENEAGIPMDAAEQNYISPNQNPEIDFVLTPFLALNAFTDFSVIVSFLQPVSAALSSLLPLVRWPS
ncbi:type I phosphomannose isomerase catalytic subunit, partial [Salmonella enterica]|uniref:type I phosphomannose isomerase catalytic subunit n=1 Tax=Salmonella enterica TaxID=28901 RepID=UPI00398C41AB